MAPPRREHYVDNALFCASLGEHRKAYALAVREGREPPRVPDYIARCIMLIATHVARMSNFADYLFKEDMIADGIENCIRYVRTFDPKRSKYALAYFTQTCMYAFIRRIVREKKQLYAKFAASEVVMSSGGGTTIHDSETGKWMQLDYSKDTRVAMSKFMTDFEASQEKKRDKKIARRREMKAAAPAPKKKKRRPKKP